MNIQTVQIPSGLNSLLAPLDYLLTCGGDTRLHLQPVTLLNTYGCRAFPRPEAITFASTTASSISDRGYAAAQVMYRGLVESAVFTPNDFSFYREIERLRSGLAELLGIAQGGHQIVFSPSGTDSGLHMAFIAQSTLGTPLTNVIVASDETGSGTPLAAAGRHFSSLTALGVAVTKGGPIEGMSEHVKNVGVPLRAANGALRTAAELDEEVTRAVATAVSAGAKVLLHVMDSSKLGWRAPSIGCVEDLCRRWPDAVLVVVDACQMRLSRDCIRAFLERGYVVQITGSKFFTGPPFSGALLIPAALAERMERVTDVPAGLCHYTAMADWPECWPQVRSKLPATMNVGQFLRWTAAVEEMRAYFTTPSQFRQHALSRFSSIVSELIARCGNLELLPDSPSPVTSIADNEEFRTRTNFPFLVRREGRLLSLNECTSVYRALNHDIYALLPDSATAEERSLGAQLGHIGQPVAVRDASGFVSGALRIAAGARYVSGNWVAGSDAESDSKLDFKFHQVQTVLEKIQLILRYFDAVKGSF